MEISLPTPVVIIQEVTDTSVSFTFNKAYAQALMNAIWTDFPEMAFYAVEPEYDLSPN